VYRDNDIGASTLSKKKRPDFDRIMTAAERGDFDVILAYSTSRLTRRPKEFETLIELAEKHGTRVYTDRSGDPDFTTAQGRGVARTLAAWDAAQAEQTGENIESTYPWASGRGLLVRGRSATRRP
jgi:DNA invertase Pin-like site-specific DNA recombinase